ncbi:MAG: putative DNA-binding domain-containing protein [Thiolinea sp.]
MKKPPAALRELQTAFASSIFTNDRKMFSEQVFAQGQLSAEQRIGIYRNSVHGILWQYLASLYEVCDQLLGEKFFEQLSDEFIDHHPPASPFLSDYGEQLPSFMRAHEALSDMPWISDIAAVEWARHAAWNDVNQPTVDFNQLAMLPPEQQLELRFRLPNSARLIRSPYATHAIWLAHQPEDHPDKQTLEDIQLQQATQLIIWRKGIELHQNSLSTEEWAFLHALQDNKTLAELSEEFAEQTGILLPTAIQNGWILSF